MWLPTIDIPNHFADIQFYSHVVFSIVLIVADAGFLERALLEFPWFTEEVVSLAYWYVFWQNLKVLSVDH